MYKLKQLPEDFIVREKSTVRPKKQKDRYCYFVLKKKGCSTMQAIDIIAQRLKRPLKDFGFAGLKDKNAVTEQVCSVKMLIAERFEMVKFNYIELKPVGYGRNPVSLGMLKGNEFEIIVRNVEKKPHFRKKFVNFYGEQRFGRRNADIGRHLVKKEFEKVCKEIIADDGRHAELVAEYLQHVPNDYVGALRQLPKKMLRLYVNAFQALLWNKIAAMYAKKGMQRKIAVVGFGSEVNDDVVKEILADEGVSCSDFLIRQLPDASAEGVERKLFATAKKLKIGKLEEDELNAGMKKVKLKFFLDKGGYATEFVRQTLC